MEDRLFEITVMPPSRLADYYLCYYGGCVFIDFNNYGPDRICLRRISFDGYGCCGLPENAVALDVHDSRLFKEQFKNKLNDQELLLTLVKKAIALNRDNIWPDALEKYELI